MIKKEVEPNRPIDLAQSLGMFGPGKIFSVHHPSSPRALTGPDWTGPCSPLINMNSKINYFMNCVWYKNYIKKKTPPLAKRVLKFLIINWIKKNILFTWFLLANACSCCWYRMRHVQVVLLGYWPALFLFCFCRNNISSIRTTQLWSNEADSDSQKVKPEPEVENNNLLQWQIATICHWGIGGRNKNTVPYMMRLVKSYKPLNYIRIMMCSREIWCHKMIIILQETERLPMDFVHSMMQNKSINCWNGGNYSHPFLTSEYRWVERYGLHLLKLVR